jgi:ubiquinone/menaquinone biosynthesis C-methylase UbiE
MNKIKTGFDTERLRKKYLSQQKLQKLQSAYSAKHPQIENLNTPDFWDMKFSDVTTEAFPMARDRNNQILKFLSANSKILNLGSGKGYLEELIENKFGDSISLTGTDFTQKSLSRLTNKFKSFEFIKTNLTKLPFKASSFDFVFLIEVLEHISPPKTFALLKEMRRVVKKDGKVIISVPINEGLEEMMPDNPNNHVRDYSEELLRYEVEKAGFKVVKVYRYSAFGKLYRIKTIINKLLKIKHHNNILFLLEK